MSDEKKANWVPYFGDYVLFDELGRGGMGVVYDAQQASLDRRVALKVLHPNFAAAQQGAERLRIEAEAASRLDHANIVPIYEFGEHEGQPYLAMGLIEGESLAQRVSRGPQFSPREGASVVAKIALAVHHAHERGVLHRDLKPGNILLDEDGEPHLVDFGLAKCLGEDSGMTLTGAFVGTPAYASPEQAAGRSKLVTTASDVYSLGAILYAVLAGQPPFSGETPSEIIEKVKHISPIKPRLLRPKVPPDLETICLKCLAKEPSRRYASALGIAEDIGRFLGSRPISARPTGSAERLWLWARRKPAHAGLVVTLCLLGLAGLVVQQNRTERVEELAVQRLHALRTQSLMMMRLTSRENGWFDKAWRLAEEASKSRTKEGTFELRNQTAALLSGLDAHLERRFTNYGASSVAFDREGKRLLMGGLPVPFSPNDILDLAGLAARLRQPSLSDAPSLYLTNELSAPTWGLLSGGVVGTNRGNDVALQFELARDFNALVRGPGLYDEQRFAGVTLSSEAQRLLAEKQQGAGLVRLNRLLLEEAYQGKISSRIGELRDGAKLWTKLSNAELRSRRASDGPVGFADDGTAVELLYNADHHSLALVASFDAKTNQEWTIPRQLGSSEIPKSAPMLMTLARDHPSALASFTNVAGQHVLALFESNTVRCLKTFSNRVTALSISADGDLVAAAEMRGRVNVWMADGVGDITSLPNSREEVLCLALKRINRIKAGSSAEDGARGTWLLAAGHLGGDVRVWDLSSGVTVAECRGSYIQVTALAFSPDGTILASGGRGVKLWDVATGRLLLDIGEDFVTGLDFSPDGRRLAVGSSEGNDAASAAVWSLDYGRGIQTLRGLSSRVEKVCFSRDGQKLAAFSHNWEVGLWNVATGQRLRVFEAPPGEYPDNAALALSPSGQRLVFAGQQATKLWDVESGRELGSWELASGLVNLPRLLDEDQLVLFRAEALEQTAEPFWETSPKGHDRVCRIRQLLIPDAARTVAVITDFNRRIMTGDAPPDGRFFVASGLRMAGKQRRREIQCFDSRTGSSVWKLPSTATGGGEWLTPDTSGSLIAFRTNEQNVVLVDLSSGVVVRQLPWLPFAIAPRAALYTLRTGDLNGTRESGYSLFKDPNQPPLISLGIDIPTSAYPQFDSYGQVLAWGNVDGTVTVCDLAAINRRMAEIELGW